jgi:hypothetical protein
MTRKPLQLGLSKTEFKHYLKKLDRYVLEKNWTRMWFKPQNKTFRPYHKGMKYELFEKIQSKSQQYVGQEIVEVRILVDPKCVDFPLMEGGERGRTVDQMAISIYTSVYTIGKNKKGELVLLTDAKRRCLVVNYYLDNLKDGKFKITLGLVEMITKLMISKKVSSTPLNGISYDVFKKRVLEVSKRGKKNAKTKK